jgi:phosphoribosylformylglycinamidine synthase subunit PurQ / glutaminase
MGATVGIVVFPGSNCDQDVHHVVERVVGAKARWLWHRDTDLNGVDAVILPGGFSYGDYLRAGAIAHLSPVMDSVRDFAAKGGPVLGVCNGFQVLLESRMLPGALMRNEGLEFVCRDVRLEVVRTDTPWTRGMTAGAEVVMPVAHHDGNYFADDETLKRLEGEGQVVFRYRDNPNGSRNDIAGICNDARNVVGLMPHPERCAEAILGGEDGRAMFESLLG